MKHAEDRVCQPDLWVIYVDGSAGLDRGKMTRDQQDLIQKIADQPPPEAAPDKIRYLARLGWILAIAIASAVAFGGVLAGLHALKDLV